MLRLQTQPKPVFVYNAVLAGDRAGQEVSGIELYPWLSSKDIDVPSCGRVIKGASHFQTILARQYPAMVVASSDCELFIFVIDALSNRSGLREIKRRSRDRCKLARRYQRLIYRNKLIGLQL